MQEGDTSTAASISLGRRGVSAPAWLPLAMRGREHLLRLATLTDATPREGWVLEVVNPIAEMLQRQHRSRKQASPLIVEGLTIPAVSRYHGCNSRTWYSALRVTWHRQPLSVSGMPLERSAGHGNRRVHSVGQAPMRCAGGGGRDRFVSVPAPVIPFCAPHNEPRSWACVRTPIGRSGDHRRDERPPAPAENLTQ